MDTVSAGDDDYDDDDFESDVFDQLKEMFSKPYSYRKCTLESVFVCTVLSVRFLLCTCTYILVLYCTYVCVSPQLVHTRATCGFFVLVHCTCHAGQASFLFAYYIQPLVRVCVPLIRTVVVELDELSLDQSGDDDYQKQSFA